MKRMIAPGLVLTAIAAVFLPVVAAAPAKVSAGSEQYRGCDGYGEATREGDGMTRMATVLFIFSPPNLGNTARGDAAHGEAGVADCNAALDDLPSNQWMRRISLLQARAVHRMEIGPDRTRPASIGSVQSDPEQIKAALADLDLAEAAVPANPDPIFLRTLAWDGMVLRAYMLRRNHDEAGAEKLAMQAYMQRPYSRETLFSVLMALGRSPDKDDEKTVTQGLAKLAPVTIGTLFQRAMFAKDYQQVIDLYPQLVPPRELPNGNVSDGENAERDWRNFRSAEIFRAACAGEAAYALAATGDAAGARAALAAARTRLADDTQPPPMPDAAAKDPKAAALWRGDVATRQRSAAEAGKILDTWTPYVEDRILIAEGKIDDAQAAMKSQDLRLGMVVADLQQAIAAKLPKKPKKQEPSSGASPPPINVITTQAMLPASDQELALLYKSLPHAEIASRLPPYERRSSLLFSSSGRADPQANGYRVSAPDSNGIVSISFRGVWTSDSIVEEMALLCAADTARRSGKKAFVIVDRDDTRYTSATTYYGTVVRTDPNGFLTILDIDFVDPAALPEKYRGAPWRVLDADAIYAALAPIYIKPADRKKEP